MADHPIQGLMRTAMEQITEMVNVNTIVGDAIETPDGSVIMPISKVNFGFAAGGSEFPSQQEQEMGHDIHNPAVAMPFGGGSGGGVSITPIAFLVVGKNQTVKIVPLDNQTHLYERLIDSAPQVVDRIQSFFKGTVTGGSMNSLNASGVQGMQNPSGTNLSGETCQPVTSSTGAAIPTGTPSSSAADIPSNGDNTKH